MTVELWGGASNNHPQPLSPVFENKNSASLKQNPKTCRTTFFSPKPDSYIYVLCGISYWSVVSEEICVYAYCRFVNEMAYQK